MADEEIERLAQFRIDQIAKIERLAQFRADQIAKYLLKEKDLKKAVFALAKIMVTQDQYILNLEEQNRVHSEQIPKMVALQQELDVNRRSLMTTKYLLGFADGKADVARKNAMKRHAENHAMKADVFTWLETNMARFKSMDAAAEAVIKQQPIAFRTARDWVGEWKKLRSASTP